MSEPRGRPRRLTRLLGASALAAAAWAAPLPGAAAPVEPAPPPVHHPDDAAPPELRPAPPGLADALRERAATAGPTAAAMPGEGFELFPGTDYRNWGSYRLVLVASPGVEGLRGELRDAAVRLAGLLQAPVTVADGAVAPPPGGAGGNLGVAVGEIRVAVSSSSPCGPLDASRVGCGGPSFFTVDGQRTDLAFGGQVWLSPALAGSGSADFRRRVIEHELGHALGLDHFSGTWPSSTAERQLMNPVVREAPEPLDAPTYRSGDVNGLGYVKNPTGSVVALAYCDFLSRRVEPDGYRYWLGRVLRVDEPGTTLSGFLDGVARSEEYLSTSVRQLYAALLGRTPTGSEVAHWVDELRSGRRTPAQVASSFDGSVERLARFPSREAWIDAVYRDRLGRGAAPAEQAGWLARAERFGTIQAAFDIYQSDESLRRRVDLVYRQLLRRAAEPGGLDHWAPIVGAQGELVLSRDVAGSPEYALRAPTLLRSCPGDP